ncbi:hypothetical protein CH330_04755, partial [candidate division WOR-3 bacterium JGI_Cruoil_03_51_56]
GHDFALSRKRDGIMYEQELTCCGDLKWVDGRFEATEVKWYSHPARNLEVLSDKHVKLYYEKELLTPTEAEKLLRLTRVEYNGFTEQYGICMPETVFIYVYQAETPHQGFSTYSNPINTIWMRVSNRQQLLHPEKGNPICTFAHEFARISLQPFADAYPPAKGADDWSHYAPFVGIIPYVDSILGDSAWFTPCDYQSYGIPLFEKLYKGGEDTYAWLLYEIDQKFGKRLIGDAIRKVAECKHWRHPDMEAFMTALGQMTKDEDVIERIVAAYPTPFEHSFYRFRKWERIGIKPVLDRMFFDNTFVIDSVVAGSLADSLGFEQGDAITKIDGFLTDTQKAACKRNLLLKNKGDRLVFTIQKAGKEKQLELTIR